MRSPYPVPALLLGIAFTTSFTLSAQISNPVPEAIERGDLTLELETFATIPPSASGEPRARISALRALPDGRLFVNDLRGKLYRVADGTGYAYLDLKTEFSRFIDSPGLGTGFQSFAFHPEFATNGKFYTTHTEPWNTPGELLKGPTAPVNSGGHQGIVTEWTATDPSSNIFSGTRRELFRVYFPGTVHGLQEITFNPNAMSGDPDYGNLYVCIGEGGGYLEGYADNEHRLDSPMGTIFRINPAGNNAPNGAYGIPTDNPWAESEDDTVLKEIFAYGFRNPHRLSWDVGGDGLALVGDIGERNLEELNILLSGGDYGFPEREGTFLLQPDQPQDNDDVYPLPVDDAQFGYTYPVAQYDHDEGFAIMGGFVYRGDALPALRGTYVFGDIKNGRVLYLQADDLALGSQTEILEATLSVNGAEVTLQSLVGDSRADLRFGVDGDQELYILTKTDGVIRKVVGFSNESPTQIDSTVEDWMLLEDFEDGLGSLTLRQQNGSPPTTQPDPLSGIANQILQLDGAGSTVSFPLPTSSADAVVSYYFRFAFASTTTGLSTGPSDSASPVSANQIQAEIKASGAGSLEVRDGFSLDSVSEDLRPAVWYESWLFYDGAEDVYSVYLRGGEYSAPALLASGSGTRLPTVGALQHFILSIATNASVGEAIYFDDLYLDPTGYNLSSPTRAGWSLVENFETTGSLDDWFFWDVDTSTEAPAEGSFEWLTETSGNAYLKVRATPSGNTTTLAATALPSPFQVGENLTFYGRVRPESPDLNLVWGIGNVDSEAFPTQRYDALEAMLRFTNEESTPLLVRDDNAYVAASGGSPIEPTVGAWSEFWLVIRNGGEASGGQTFDLYWRPEHSTEAPALVYSDAGFRIARELPLSHFGLLANHGATTATGSFSFDDLFVAPGEILERPEGTGSGFFPGPRGNKTIPWFGFIWDGARPWIAHQYHGWLYIPEQQETGIWAYDLTLGWLYTDPVNYPYLFSFSEGRWFYYYDETTDPRWFYRFDGETNSGAFSDAEYGL